MFIILQISMLLTNTLLAFAFPEVDNDLAVHRFYHIKFMLLNIIGTSIYFYIIWRFIFSLENGIYVVHIKRKKPPPVVVSETVERHSITGPSAPWSDSPSVSSRLQHPHIDQPDADEGDYQTLPLTQVPATTSSSEPQPCSSKS